MNNILLQFENLYKIYVAGETKVSAVCNVSLSINSGEFVAVTGHSGSGKSTFLNIIGCLDKPTSGKYFLENVDIAQLDKNKLAEIRNKKFGFIFQNFNLLQRTTALENVELPMIYAGISGKKSYKRASDLLELVGLKDKLYSIPSKLSGGQQQRVAIARALANNPSIILEDEPTGNLDSNTSMEIMNIFTELNKNNITIILVTHEEDIARYARRNIIFKDGKIINSL